VVESAQLHHRRDEGAAVAEHFVASQRSESARTDAFFDAAGTDLLAGLLLAAAVAKRPITQNLPTLLADPRNDEPERILRSTPGLQLSADALAGVISAPEKQRGGIYGTAQQSAQFLINRKVTRWVIPNGRTTTGPSSTRTSSVREGGTLYSLSKEGASTAGPLVTALTVAVVEAAEDYAKTCAGGGCRARWSAYWTRLRTSAAGRTARPLQPLRFPRHRLMTILQSWRRAWSAGASAA